MVPPLAGKDRQILDLLMAGRTFDDVCAIGAYRRTFKPSDVHRVVAQWLPERRPARIAVPDPVPPPRAKPRHRQPPKEIEHGKPAGYYLHHKRGETPCDACCEARNRDDADRKRKRTA